MSNNKRSSGSLTGLLISLLVLTSSLESFAQSQSQSKPNNRIETDFNGISCPNDIITIEVKVQGKNVHSLVKDNFTIYEDGVEQDIRFWVNESGTDDQEAAYALAYSPVYLYDGKSHKIRVVARRNDKRKLKVQFSPKGYIGNEDPRK